MVHRLRAGVTHRGHLLQQLPPDPPCVGGALVERVVPLLAVTGDDRQPLRSDPLQRRKPLRVRRHLQQGGHLESTRELGVGDVVRPGPAPRAVVALHQEVGVATPLPIEEGALVDDVDAGLHQPDGLGLGCLQGRAAVPVQRDLDDLDATVHQRLLVRRLVLEAAPEEDLQLLALLRRLRAHAARDLHVEAGEVVAGQALRQVGRADDEVVVEELHEPILFDGYDIPQPSGRTPYFLATSAGESTPLTNGGRQVRFLHCHDFEAPSRISNGGLKTRQRHR